MADEHVRMWRAPNQDRILLMAGRTAAYAIEPRGEYVFGVVAGRTMRARRGRERHRVAPGQLVAWDPSEAHSGVSADGRPWASRLIVVEAGDLREIAADEDMLIGDVAFPSPVVDDAGLIRDFVALHRALEAPASRLERDERLAVWLRDVTDLATRRPAPSSTPRDDRALRQACDYLAEHAAENVGLDELAAAAGVGKFRLVRIFRERTGMSPHSLQLAHRIRRSRRLIERGESPAAAAAAAGFTDQSHMHRHFVRSLGMTPGAYRRRFAA